MVTISRRLFYVGMFSLSMLRFKLKVLDASDLIFALSAIALLLSVNPPARAPRARGWMLGTGIITLAGTLAAFDAVSWSSDIQVVFNGVFVILIWAWANRQLLDTAKRVHGAMIAFVLGTSISALIAFVQTKFHILGSAAGHGASAERAVGLSLQPNIAAISYALALVFAIGLGMHLGFRRHWYLGVCIVFLAAALIFTASVSGQASTLLAVIVLFVRRGIKIRTLLAIFFSLAIVYTVAVAVQTSSTGYNLNPLARLQQTTGQNTGYNTVNPREATLKNAWGRTVQDPIIGHGIDIASSFVYYDPNVGQENATHDFIVLLLYEGGVLMLFGFAITMGSGIRRMLLYRGPTTDILLCGMVAVLFFSLQSPELFDRWLWLPFVLAISWRPSMKEEDLASAQLRRRATVVATGSATAAVAAEAAP
jgi:hypothetical protein